MRSTTKLSEVGPRQMQLFFSWSSQDLFLSQCSKILWLFALKQIFFFFFFFCFFFFFFFLSLFLFLSHLLCCLLANVLQVWEIFLNYFFDDFYSSIFNMFSLWSSCYLYAELLDRLNDFIIFSLIFHLLSLYFTLWEISLAFTSKLPIEFLISAILFLISKGPPFPILEMFALHLVAISSLISQKILNNKVVISEHSLLFLPDSFTLRVLVSVSGFPEISDGPWLAARI